MHCRKVWSFVYKWRLHLRHRIYRKNHFFLRDMIRDERTNEFTRILLLWESQILPWNLQSRESTLVLIQAMRYAKLTFYAFRKNVAIDSQGEKIDKFFYIPRNHWLIEINKMNNFQNRWTLLSTFVRGDTLICVVTERFISTYKCINNLFLTIVLFCYCSRIVVAKFWRLGASAI